MRENMDSIIQEYYEIQKSLLCLVCNKIPANIVISDCEHLFCDHCVEILLKDRLVKCPKCSTNLTKRMFVPNPTLTNLVSSLNLFQLLMNVDEQTKGADVMSACNLVVNHSVIENYLENNMTNCKMTLDDIASSVKEPEKNSKEKLDTSFDEFISVSQLPPPADSRNSSPLKVYTRKIKPVEKVKSWLTKHTTEFTIITPSQKQYKDEVEQPNYIITQPSFSQINSYVVPRTENSSDDTDSQDKSSKELESGEKSLPVNENCDENEVMKISMQECEVKLTNIQNHLSVSDEGSVTYTVSKQNNMIEKLKINVSDTILNIVQDKTEIQGNQDRCKNKIFTTDIDEDTCSLKCNQSHEKHFQLQKSKINFPSKTRKTFSLEANTEDLQNIENSDQANTEQMLRSIFEKRVAQTPDSSREQTQTKTYPPKPLCMFIKGANLTSKHHKHLKLQKQTVKFLLKGPLVSIHSKFKNISVQTMDNIITETQKQIETNEIGIQTNLEQVPSDCTSYVSDSEYEKEIPKITENTSPEIELVENISNVDITVIPNYNNDNTDSIDISYEDTSSKRSKYDIKITNKKPLSRRLEQNIVGIKNETPNVQNNKRKRSADKFISERPSKTFKRIRNTSTSSESESDFQSCLHPIKDIDDNENLGMDEDMTVKFLTMHESENSEMLLKHKTKRLTSSSSSSQKENEVTKTPVANDDSEPLNYDEILSTVFANIDAELHPSLKKIESPKNKSEIANTYLNNITNTNSKSPVKKVKEPLKSNHQDQFNIPSSTPICNSKKFKSFGTANKILDTSIESINKTSDIDRIVGALENDYLQKELDAQNKMGISFEEQEIIKTNQIDTSILNRTNDSENEVKKTSGLLTHRPNTSKSKTKAPVKSKRSLVFLDNNNKTTSPSTQEQSQSRFLKNMLDETISTIIDYPKPNTLSEKPHDISYKNQLERNISDMELCSPLDVNFELEKTLISEEITNLNKSQELIANTEKTLMKTLGESESDFVPNSMEIKQFCIACSCLTQDEIKIVKMFTEQFNLRFVTQYEDDVTHLVVRVNQENRCERSLKFINAMANGVWAINKNWISDSISAKKLLPEDKYEALDVSLEPGPKRNRNAIRGSLFSFLTVMLIGPFSSTTTEQFKTLLQTTGVNVVNHGNIARMIVVDENSHTEDQIEDLHNKFKIPVVDMMWFLDCICRGRVTNVSDYIIFPLEIDQSKYPAEWFQGTEQCS